MGVLTANAGHGQIEGDPTALVHLDEVPDVVDFLGVDISYAGHLLQFLTVVGIQVGRATSIGISKGDILEVVGLGGDPAVESYDCGSLAATARFIQEGSAGLDDHAVDEGQRVHITGGKIGVTDTENVHEVGKLERIAVQGIAAWCLGAGQTNRARPSSQVAHSSVGTANGCATQDDEPAAFRMPYTV